MQDGSILANLVGETQLLLLHPDRSGSYANGSWSPAGNFILAKWAYASAVLSDGRLITCGGEYSGPGLPQTETNFCEIYDPRTQSSLELSPPPGWGSIGDSPSVVLNDGTFLLGNTQGMGAQVALLDPVTLTWTFGGGDQDNEQGYVLLQTGDVITTDVYAQMSKRYSPSTNAFLPDADLPVMLGADSEIGPGITLMDGRVIWFGATGHTCIYTPGAAGTEGQWQQAPDMPLAPNGDQLIASDVPAILEPNGAVLLAASGANTSTTFLEFDPVIGWSSVNGAPTSSDQEPTRMLLLPSGRGLVSMSTSEWYEVEFSPGGDPSWAPSITSFPATVVSNETVTLAGTQLCGLSECSTYGDDNQQAETYPTVRFIDSNDEITYVRAHDVSTRSIAPGEFGTVLVDIPACLEPGPYSVQLIATGIPSNSVDVTVAALRHRDFEVMVGLDNAIIGRFYRDNSVSGYPWSGRVDGFPGAPLTHVSLVPSHLLIRPGQAGVSTLEAMVATIDGTLQHWQYVCGSWSLLATLPEPVDFRGDPIAIAGPPSMIQGTYGSLLPWCGNFEVLVPLNNGNIGHYYRDNNNPDFPWYFGEQFGGPDAIGVSLAQTDYGTADGTPGNLECVVVRDPDDELKHFYRDNQPPYLWHPGPVITNLSNGPGAGGGPALIQPRPNPGIVASDHYNFEVVVPTSATTLAHFYRDNSGSNQTWYFTEEFGSGVFVSMIRSSFDSLEVVASGGDGLTHYWRHASGGQWNEGATFALDSAGGAPGFVEDVY